MAGRMVSIYQRQGTFQIVDATRPVPVVRDDLILALVFTLFPPAVRQIRFSHQFTASSPSNDTGLPKGGYNPNRHYLEIRPSRVPRCFQSNPLQNDWGADHKLPRGF
jgi:hypothetical protein